MGANRAHLRCGLTHHDVAAIGALPNPVAIPAEFQTSKFYCKTDFDMKKIAEEEANYKNYQIPKFYTFPSKDAKERILYQNFVSVNLDVKNMIDEITKFKVK